MLRAENIIKRYKGRPVVNGVSVEVGQGEIVGLLGPNGAGKTTSFYMIVGLVASEGGSIKLDDDDLTRQPMDMRARKGLGYLPQEASVFRKLTVEQNIMGVLEILPGLNQHQRQRKLDGLLQEYYIEHIRQNLGMSLSGGASRNVVSPCAICLQDRRNDPPPEVAFLYSLATETHVNRLRSLGLFRRVQVDQDAFTFVRTQKGDACILEHPAHLILCRLVDTKILLGFEPFQCGQ